MDVLNHCGVSIGRGVEQKHILAHKCCFFYAVSDENDGDVGLTTQLKCKKLQRLTCGGIEGCERLVH